MSTEVARIYRFRGVHSLPGFDPPWCYPHQHDYTVEVVVAGDTPTDDVDKAWFLHAPSADIDSHYQPSTVENIALVLLRQLNAVRVTVWEDQARWGRAVR